jgi:hypothetical protein
VVFEETEKVLEKGIKVERIKVERIKVKRIKVERIKVKRIKVERIKVVIKVTNSINNNFLSYYINGKNTCF